MVLIANEKIRHNGILFEKKSEVKGISKKDEKRLIELGVVTRVEVSQSNNPAEEGLDEQYEKLANAIDKKYNRDLLAQVAKELKVEFSNNAKKDEIIDAVINQGKAKELLKDEDE